MTKKQKLFRILQGVGLATVGTVLAQPDIITGTLTPGTQAKVIGVIAIINALLPAFWPKKTTPPAA